MKRKIVFIALVAIISVTTSVKAQYDTWMMNQYLNNMTMNLYQQQQQMINEAAKILNQEMERQKSQATAFCTMIPSDNGNFFGYVSLVYLGAKNLKIVVKDGWGDKRTVKSSSWYNINGAVITQAEFAPGDVVFLYNRESGKRLQTINIPLEDSPEYEKFAQSGRDFAIMLIGQGNSALSGMKWDNENSGSSSYSGDRKTKKTCSLCGGKGWVAGSKNVSYNISSYHWCEDCKKEVLESHSHDRCPSCSGFGYTKY